MVVPVEHCTASWTKVVHGDGKKAGPHPAELLGPETVSMQKEG